ncbi:hypothetical protein SEVIR_9G154925v4 [Setaria viridis]
MSVTSDAELFLYSGTGPAIAIIVVCLSQISHGICCKTCTTYQCILFLKEGKITCAYIQALASVVEQQLTHLSPHKNGLIVMQNTEHMSCSKATLQNGIHDLDPVFFSH